MTEFQKAASNLMQTFLTLKGADLQGYKSYSELYNELYKVLNDIDDALQDEDEYYARKALV